ncbi:MAG: type II toxin-antitoxin system HicB family antitoxin [Clostridiales bacterium]|nr:type II toxin-antitoxin system HicB family antitoxin [Clostridiales bacterium]
MNNILIYPAIFTKEDDGFWVNFIDFDGVYSDGNDLQEATLNASKALGLLLEDMSEYPQPTTDVSKIKLEKNQFISFLSIDLNVYREKFSNKTIKKTLSLPAWLNTMALENNINFSETLKEALFLKLNIDK